MRCPYCGQTETKVIDSRATVDSDAIRRRRECLKCSQRYTTYERIEESPLTIIKKDGQREIFDRNKLKMGILRATVKRHVSDDDIERLINNIETELRNKFQYEVKARNLGNMVLKRLREIDKVAYIRFASVYKEFSDLDDFISELSKLK